MTELRALAGHAPEQEPAAGPATQPDAPAGPPGERAQRGPAAAPGRQPDARAVPVGDLIEAVLARSGYLEALEAEGTIEAQGRIENLEQLVEVGGGFDAPPPPA